MLKREEPASVFCLGSGGAFHPPGFRAPAGSRRWPSRGARPGAPSRPRCGGTGAMGSHGVPWGAMGRQLPARGGRRSTPGCRPRGCRRAGRSSSIQPVSPPGRPDACGKGRAGTREKLQRRWMAQLLIDFYREKDNLRAEEAVIPCRQRPKALTKIPYFCYCSSRT